MKKIKLFTLLLFSISAFSQGWLPVGGAYQLCQSPCLGNSNTNADTDLALNNANQPYVFYANSVFGDGDKMVKKFENGNWSNVGNINFTAACVEPSIYISNGGTPYIAYQNADYKAEARFLNGPTWQLLGTAGFSPDLANGITIRVNSNNQPFVAYADGNQLGKMTVKKYNWNTSQWETVGAEGFSSGRATYVDFEIATNDDLYVSYIDGDSNFGELQKMCVKKFDGTNWVSVGIDRFTTESIYYSSFALDNNNVPYVIYTDLDETLPKLSVQKFNGTAWEYVGTSRFSSTETNECDITFDVNNKPNIVYKKPNYDNNGIYTHDSLSSMLYESGSWQFFGLQNFSPWTYTVKPCIEIGSNNVTYISDEQAYYDINSNIIVGGYVSYFGTVTTLVNPSLTSVSQSGVNCSNQSQSISFSGLQPNSTSTIEYNINGVVQPNITNLSSNSSGYASIGINIPTNISGQTLTVTKVIRTDIAGTTDLICSISTTVQSNANITYYQDSDGDGLGDPTQTYQSCEGQPLNYVTNNTDCDASNPNAFINTFSNPTPSVCAAGSPVLVSITDNSRPVSGTTGGCLLANYGQYPGSDYTPTNYDGVTPNIILTNGYAGEYSVVNIVPNTKYIFKSERFYNESYGANSQNDKVTIGSFDGTTILASGQHTAVWQSTVAMQIRFYSHANYNFQNAYFVGPCGTESFSRTRSIICAPTTIVKPVVWSPASGLFTDAAGTIPYTGTAVTSVYAKPNQNTTYSLTNVNGCEQANAITVVISNVGTTYYQDADNDGFGNNVITQQSCDQPVGYVVNNTDCDDTNSLVFFTQLNYIDLDQDGYTNGTILLCRGLGEAPAGYTISSNGSDCDDTNSNFHDATIIYYADADNDGFGNALVSQTACIQPAGYVTNNTDCDDTNSEYNSIQFVYADTDGDGFGSGSVVEVCGGFFPVPPPVGFVRNNSDCDDTDATVGLPTDYYIDNDFDGYGSNEVIASDCSQPFGFVTNNNDCDDYDDSINLLSQFFADNDNDGFGNVNVSIFDCTEPFGYVTNNIDCDDSNFNINPNQTEIANNNIDENCNGMADDNGIYTSIPDNNFEQALYDQGIDTVLGDNKVLTSAINTIEYLDVSYNNISSLTGINSFIALQQLICSHNLLTTLNISNLSSLLTIQCDHNQINQSIDLSNLLNLQFLDCSNNQITGLNLSGLSNLEYLYCDNNLITSINLNGLTSIKTLTLNNNQLLNINFDSLELNQLEYLGLSNNLLTNLDVTELPILKNLGCTNNNLNVLNVSNLNWLEILDCSYNDLTNLNVSGLSNLVYLTCENNLLTSLSLNGAADLYQLRCKNNLLTNLDLSDLISLQFVSCEFNLLSSINTTNTISLSQFLCRDNQLTNLNVFNLSQLGGLNCQNNNLISLFTPISLRYLNCQNNDLVSLDLSESLNLNTLICTINPNLSCIKVSNSQITDFVPYSGWVKDSGAEYNLTCNSQLSSILSGNATICSGDSTNINVAINGGTSPYTVVINDGFTNNTITNYVSGTNISVNPITNTTYTLVSVIDATSLVGTENSGLAIILIGTPVLYYQDLDGDGFGNDANTFFTCTVATGYVTNNLDCDDTNSLINPDVAEIAYDGIDNDCDGVLDNGFQLFTTEVTSPACGSTLATPSSLVGVRNFSLSKNVTSYRYKATGPSGDLTVEKTTPHFQFSELVGWQYGTTYTVSCELQVGGVWAGYYGPTCTISTPNVVAAGLSQVVSPTCGSVVTPNAVIATTSLGGVTGYRFQVTNTTPGYAGSNAVQTIDRTVQWFKLNLLAEYVYGSTYTVEVAVKTTGTYGAFGPVCTFTTTAPVIAQCGTTVTAGSLISSTSMGGVTQYTYQVTNLSNSNVQTIVRTSPNFSTNLITGYSSTTSYSISVAVTSTGVQSPYSEVCVINDVPAVRQMNTSYTSELKVNGFPNPFTNNFTLDITTTSEENVSVMVYDMIGKLLDKVQVNATDNALELGANYPAGVYNVIVSQGEKVKTVRMIKR